MAPDATVQIDRATRVDIKLDLEFFSPLQHSTGYSVNLSESGVLGVFERQLDIWNSGDLRISVGEERWTVEARVARVAADGVALTFRNLHADQRSKLRALIGGVLATADAPQFHCA
jgi:hypothetical protein